MQIGWLRSLMLAGVFFSLLHCGGAKDAAEDDTAPIADNTGLTGAQLYAANCESCHFSLNSSAKQGRSAAQITNAIATVSNMSVLQGTLTSEQIASIAEALQ